MKLRQHKTFLSNGHVAFVSDYYCTLSGHRKSFLIEAMRGSQKQLRGWLTSNLRFQASALQVGNSLLIAYSALEDIVF